MAKQIKDERGYATCPIIPDSNAKGDKSPCREPLQATVERWYNVIEDGMLVVERGIASAGGGQVKVYCRNDHEVTTVEIEPSEWPDDVSGGQMASLVLQAIKDVAEDQ